jgi:uncharacterized peroxidase-related enzyme
MSFFTSLKNATSIINIFQENPKKYMPSLTLAEEVLREPSVLDPVVREVLASYVYKLNNCEYCWGSHREFALSLGYPEDKMDQVLLGISEDAKLLALMKYVGKLTLTPAEISEEDFNEVLSSGVSEEELKDAIAVCAAFNYYNRIVFGHGLKANADTWKPAAEMISSHGYDRRR